MSDGGDVIPIKKGLWTAGLNGGMRLLGSHCTACGELFFPRKSGGCTHCQAATLEPVELGPYGRIDSFTAALQPPAGGFYRGPVPFCYGLIDLDDRLRVVSRIVGPHASLRRGQRVELVTEDLCTDKKGRRVQAFSFAPTSDQGVAA